MGRPAEAVDMLKKVLFLIPPMPIPGLAYLPKIYEMMKPLKEKEDSDSDDSGSDSESSTRAIKNKKHKVQPGQGNHKRRITWNFENTMVPQPVEKPKAHVKDWLAAKRRRREKSVNV